MTEFFLKHKGTFGGMAKIIAAIFVAGMVYQSIVSRIDALEKFDASMKENIAADIKDTRDDISDLQQNVNQIKARQEMLLIHFNLIPNSKPKL